MDSSNKWEKVIEGLEEILQRFLVHKGTAVDRDGYEFAVVDPVLIKDALALLKAQEPIRPRIGILHNEDGSKVYFLHCPFDGTTLDEGDKYCRKCGRMVKWDA